MLEPPLTQITISVSFVGHWYIDTAKLFPQFEKYFKPPTKKSTFGESTL
jgi:hypothetical protein